MSDICSSIINSKETDKNLGMDFCERLLRLEGKDVRTIFWAKVDDEGHHHFYCSWTAQQVISPK